MQTTSVLIQSLCVPCGNRCRYCLLSWNGTAEGAEWTRSVALAERWLSELREKMPEVKASFSFGYSMEHPNLPETIKTLQRLGSPTADFLQCDGMKMRSGPACRELMQSLRGAGIKRLNFTVYGEREYHDRFAGRKGDYDLLLRMMNAAKATGIPFDAGVPLFSENVGQIDALIDVLRGAGSERVRLFVPHEEGRGKSLAAARVRKSDLSRLSEASKSLLNGDVYRTEGDWLHDPDPLPENGRMILLSLRADNIERYEQQSAVDAVREIEALDERYYAAFPPFCELAKTYGDPEGERLFGIRDLYHHFRTRYAEEHGVSVCDVTDERRSGSRRF